MPFIRPFQPSDTEAAKAICRATLPPSLDSSPDAHRISPYLWTLQYTHLFPRSCFVLDDGEGRAVGYVIGCPDVWALAAAYPRFVAEVLHSEQGRADVPEPPDHKQAWTNDDGSVNPAAMAQMAYSPGLLVLGEGSDEKKQLATAFRATMHIDLLPGFQAAGWGRKLVERFCAGVKEATAENRGKGIHIGVAGENTKVVPFYERLGFSVYPGGEKEGNVWMVKEL